MRLAPLLLCDGEPERGTVRAGARRPSAFVLTDFQLTAARRSWAVLERWGGVLVADSVGLGKTFIALALVERAIQRGARRVLVSGPAGLRGLWRGALRGLARSGAATLAGEEPIGPSDGAAIFWVSHTALSLGRWPVAIDRPDFAVVDEAHAFRNPRTRRYRSVAGLCRSARLVLLTATPVNNSLLDLYFQLRLFLGDGSLAELGVPDLGQAFREAVRHDAGRLRPPLDGAIAAVIVRRTRGMLAGRIAADASVRFPSRRPPVPVTYRLDDSSSGLFDEIARGIEALRLDALRPPGIGSGHGAPVELVRFHLLKRIESSGVAFVATVAALRGFLEAFTGAAAEGYRLGPVDYRRLIGRDASVQLLLAPLALDRLRAGTVTSGLIDSVRQDMDALARLAAAARPLVTGLDPKLAALRELLAGELAGRKVLVFSEFRDTAVHVWRAIRPSTRCALVHGGEARLGPGRASRREVIARFAPVSNGLEPPPESERVDVLIATDVLSEGLNLQDAGDVISYDLPWNPVRLMQRVGRIDRLGSPHPTIRCFNFLPDHDLDSMLGLLDRLRTKLDAARASVGCDGGILSTVRSGPADVRWLVDGLRSARPGLFERLETASDGAFLAEHRLRAAWELACGRSSGDRPSRAGGLGAEVGPVGGDPAVPQPHPAIPLGLAGEPRAGAFRPLLSGWSLDSGQAGGWLVVMERAGRYRWIVVRAGPEGDDRVTACRVLADMLVRNAVSRADRAGRPGAVPTGPNGRDAAVAARRAEEWVRAPGRVPPDSPAARLGQWLVRVLAREPAGPDPDLCARADALLDRARAGLRAGAERALLDILRGPGGVGARQVIARLEAELDARGEGGRKPGAGGPTPAWRVFAVIELRPGSA